MFDRFNVAVTRGIQMKDAYRKYCQDIFTLSVRYVFVACDAHLFMLVQCGQLHHIPMNTD